MENPDSNCEVLTLAKLLLDNDAKAQIRIDLLPQGLVQIQSGEMCCVTTRKSWRQAVSEAEKVPQQILRAVSPDFHWYRLEYPQGLPHVENQIARMIRGFGDRTEAKELERIPDEERDGLVLSLAQTLCRATYHYKRFEDILTEAATRKRLLGATVAGDFITHYLHFEATSLWVAARGAVDQVIYIAARRMGYSGNKADEWDANKAIRETDPIKKQKYNIEEVRLLQGPYLSWYEKLNIYRNVFTHQGWRYTPVAGYYEIDATVPEARHPTNNPLLVPDITSAKGRVRPHEWTYSDGNRLEYLVREINDGLLGFLKSVGIKAWGGMLDEREGSVPIDQRPNMLVVRPRPLFVSFDSDCYIPMFTSAEKAVHFFEDFFLKKIDCPPFEVRPMELEDGYGGPGFCFILPDGQSIIEAMADFGANFSGLVKLIIDPILGTNPRRIVDCVYLHEIPVTLLMEEEQSRPLGKVMKWPTADWPGIDRIFYFRRAPKLN